MWENSTYNGRQYVTYRAGSIPGGSYDVNGWDGNNQLDRKT